MATGNYVPEITATYADGQRFNPRDASQMFLGSAGSLLRKAVDLKKSSRANVMRNLTVVGHDIRLKAGGDYRQSLRDMRDTTPSYTFLGPDGRANTEDNRLSHYDLIDERYSTVKPAFALEGFRWFDPPAVTTSRFSSGSSATSWRSTNTTS
ncbi:MAG: hypothetical protein Q7S40_12845 [Opitutaceae bacterium]|nr:hypothetical protein [Opitutaceae bacterium]